MALLPIAGAMGLLMIPRHRSTALLICYNFAKTMGILNPLVLRYVEPHLYRRIAILKLSSAIAEEISTPQGIQREWSSHP